MYDLYLYKRLITVRFTEYLYKESDMIDRKKIYERKCFVKKPDFNQIKIILLNWISCISISIRKWLWLFVLRTDPIKLGFCFRNKYCLNSWCLEISFSDVHLGWNHTILLATFSSCKFSEEFNFVIIWFFFLKFFHH